MQPNAYELNYLHEHTHWWFLARREIILGRIESLIRRKQLASPPLRILDYGCGTGGLTEALGLFGQVTGVDDNPQALEYCRKRNLQDTRLIDTPNQLPDHVYDLIASFDVLEHVEEDVHLLRHLCRALKPNGTLILTVPAYHWLWSGEDTVSRHARRYTARELKRKCRESGFQVIECTYFNTLLFPAIAGIRLFNRFMRPHTMEMSDVAPASKSLNSLLCRLFGLERSLLRYTSLPFGVSIFLAARSENSIIPLQSRL